MRISIVTPYSYPAVVYGGPIFATLYTAKALSENGIQVYISTSNADGDKRLRIETGKFIEQSTDFFIKYYNETIVNRLSISMLLLLWRDINKAEVVHAQSIFSAPTPIALIYARLLGKKVLLSPRGSLCNWCLNERKSFKRIWLKFLIKPFANNILWHATSVQEQADIQRLFPNANTIIISDGVNYDEFQNYVQMKTARYMEHFVKVKKKPTQIIVSMGRLHKVKGFDILLESFGHVLKIYPEAVLLIAGKDDGELNRLQRLRQELKIEKSVFFTGALYENEKRDFLANADLFVLPSHTENFGIVYVESLAAGTPIVASQNTPWSQVEDFDCGKWVNNSVEDTARAMIEMLGKDREQMRKNSKKLAKKYDWKNIAGDFKKLFEKMINE